MAPTGSAATCSWGRASAVHRLAFGTMSTPTPRPTAPARSDPIAVLAEVDAVLTRPILVLAEEAGVLDALHQQLAAALATIDRV